MWQYLVYFMIGGSVVATIAYVGTHHGGLLAAFVASLPVLFFVSLTLLYRNGGLDAALQYVKGSLLFLPVFVLYAVLTAWLLPRLGSLTAIIPGLALYFVPLLAFKRAQRRRLYPQQGSTDSSLSVFSQRRDEGADQ
ncbi:MAG TPA: hypothetical protein VMW13_05405 [Dehalococcoidales bacterium]|nr:hypothetical protein [Dehalococcoidales bacterium]